MQRVTSAQKIIDSSSLTLEQKRDELTETVKMMGVMREGSRTGALKAFEEKMAETVKLMAHEVPSWGPPQMVLIVLGLLWHLTR